MKNQITRIYPTYAFPSPSSTVLKGVPWLFIWKKVKQGFKDTYMHITVDDHC